MFRRVFLPGVVTSVLISSLVFAEDPTPAEKLIRKAIADLEAGREKLGDPLDQAKVDKAVRELEFVIAGDEQEDAKPAPLMFEVSPSLLKKKFSATRAVFNSKTGELMLVYDFSNKTSLADFDVGDHKVVVARKTLVLDGAENLPHKGKWKSFAMTAVLHFKGMRGIGVLSSNGSHIASGGANPDTMYLGAQDGGGASKIVPDKLRSGTIPIGFSITSSKTSANWGDERLSVPTVRKDDSHQIILSAGTEGCGFSNLVIVGVPDPGWLKEFLGVNE